MSATLPAMYASGVWATGPWTAGTWHHVTHEDDLGCAVGNCGYKFGAGLSALTGQEFPPDSATECRTCLARVDSAEAEQMCEFVTANPNLFELPNARRTATALIEQAREAAERTARRMVPHADDLAKASQAELVKALDTTDAEFHRQVRIELAARTWSAMYRRNRRAQELAAKGQHTPAVTTIGDTDCMAEIWTEEMVRALGVRTDIVTAGRVLGLGQTKARELARSGKFPCPVLKLGAVYVVPTAGLRQLLDIGDEPLT